MGTDSAIIQRLRSVRHADDVLATLREGSQEARRDRIAEALADPAFEAGPAELLYTYPHHAVCKRDDIVMRVRVHESEDGAIQLGNVEVHSIPDAAPDVAEEVMATAKAAIPFILDEDFDNARPLVACIANALSYKGDLRERVMSEVARRTVTRNAWWHKVAREHLGEDFQADVPGSTGSMAEDVTNLRTFLSELAAQAAASLTKLAEAKIGPSIEAAAEQIADDIKYAIQSLNRVQVTEDQTELAGVYQGVYELSENLALGAQFLASLADQNTQDAPQSEE